MTLIDGRVTLLEARVTLFESGVTLFEAGVTLFDEGVTLFDDTRPERAAARERTQNEGRDTTAPKRARASLE